MTSELFHTKKGKLVEVPAPLAPLADTHGHLTSFRSLDPAQAVARAALAGVRLLVVPVDPADDVPDVPAFLAWFADVRSRAADLLRDSAAQGDVPPVFAGYDDVPDLIENTHIVAGIHPYGAQRFMDDPSVRARLEALLALDACVGVGEFGLDYGPWNKLAPDVQIAAFREQLRIAHRHGLPVELHLRDAVGDEQAQAHADALRVLAEEGVPQAGCDLHCFTSGPDVMEPFVELGCRIAFGGAATFGRSDDIRAAAAACPEQLILSETDSPYMAPMPLRGRECEPAMIAFSVARLAQVREEAGAAAQVRTYEALWRNANRFFGLV
ncbi:MAG: TatD family hydrolase [Atopobiaceae bacterium]|nr:TatD family hydrolase [Atopobiaceae bacterium]